MTLFTDALALQYTRDGLTNVEREYPHHLQHVLNGPEDLRAPRHLHPLFYGCFDWHSCVHGYWMLARLWQRFPTLGTVPAIATLFSTRYTPAAIEAELTYLAHPSARGFERPYGWSWLLALQAELDNHHDPVARSTATVLAPLSAAIATQFHHYLALADYPVRSGVHSSSAFALRMAADYAERHDPALWQRMQERAWQWYGGDQAAQCWEPSQDDFLSPTLMQAECLRRLLPAAQFNTWFNAFLPALAAGQPATLFTPARVSDRNDSTLIHLDGLNLSRAWCWRALASTPHLLDEATHALIHNAIQAHVAASLPHVNDNYMSEHWLASFAVLAIDERPFD